ncbi:TIGR04219 family outer membrane beta-barrel protein [Caminibacter mediatlanticus TB-2]|uniref:TIGR04219 family outer membrane beta-barrel protein n=1 Tax=Caminibacter mediatlanticus TB-2 TaxID=391592 RepID=A0ABX5V5Y6_9BACT|nr:TIGR04219 family outer membrane beta-barrel protein [Caminibacter mediatlanticus]QCT93692.1 TIGR04219 family outer membrane beta-barrel protein [Caminibacter mediatlanticus TB-2]
MKKISLALCLAGLFTFASADIFSVSAGYGIQEQKIGGYIQNGDNKNYFGEKSVNPTDPYTGYLGLKNKKHPYFWVKLIHPIPVIPNMKFQYTKYETSGHSNYISGNVSLFGKTRITYVITDADTYMSINSYDASLFYEFKPAIADIEIGAGVDYWKLKFSVYDNVNKRYAVNYSGSIPLPYVYGNIETMKFFNFSLIGNAKIAKLGDNHHYDYLGALKYTIDIPGPINPFIKVGYKYKELFYKDGTDETKLSFKGAFAELGVKF